MAAESDLLGKTVLLFAKEQKAREARAQRLRTYGVAVQAVGTIREARFCLRNNAYDLVLLSARENPEEAIVFRSEIRAQNSKQGVAFLVGPPHYISLTYGENVFSMPARWMQKPKARLASA